MILSPAIALKRSVEAFATLAHPSYLSRWNAGHQRIRFHVFGHHSTSGDQGTLAYGMTAHHRAVGPQRSALTDSRLGIHPMNREMGSWRGHVGENTTRPTKDVVFNLNALIDGDVVLDPNTVAYAHVVAYVDILSQGTTLANDGTRLDMAEVPYLGPFANSDAFIDITTIVYKKIIHCHCFLKIRQDIRDVDYLNGQSIGIDIALQVHQASHIR